jgi:hypothetical protein
MILFAVDGARFYVAETAIDRVAAVDMRTGGVLGRSGRPHGDGLGIAAGRSSAAR